MAKQKDVEAAKQKKLNEIGKIPSAGGALTYGMLEKAYKAAGYEYSTPEPSSTTSYDAETPKLTFTTSPSTQWWTQGLGQGLTISSGTYSVPMSFGSGTISAAPMSKKHRIFLITKHGWKKEYKEIQWGEIGHVIKLAVHKMPLAWEVSPLNEDPKEQTVFKTIPFQYSKDKETSTSIIHYYKEV